MESLTAAPYRYLKELLELPVKHKTVIYLHYVEGYSIKEISDILGITESAVKSRLLRGRKQMRDMVRMEGGIYQMDRYDVKEVMDQVHISSEMQEEIIMNMVMILSRQIRQYSMRF